MQICVVGTGTMGTALTEALRKGNFKVDECTKASDANQKIADANVVMIAIKPQDFEKFAELITTDLSRKLIISIMAGVSIDKLESSLKTEHVVRVMPNIALKVGKSVSGWYAGNAVGESEKKVLKDILQSFGVEFQADKEEKLDALTAITGGGPAYFYFLLEVLEKAATKYGFTEEQGRKLAMATLGGSMELLEQSKMSPRELREKVISKGGTTEAAFEYLQSKDAGNIWLDAIDEAYNQAKGMDSSSFF